MANSEVEKYVTDLTAYLQAARDAYYKANAPIISDEEYDKQERLLHKTIQKYPEYAAIAAPILQRVGSDIVAGGRVKHTTPMLSIENKYDEKEVTGWFVDLPPGTVLCEEPKFDGISVELRYKNRELVQAVTRGTGVEGEDITQQIMVVESIPKKLNLDYRFSERLQIRGELVMKNSTLERINAEARRTGGKEYSSTRNLTGGTMKLHDLNLVRDREIQMRPWDVLGGHDLPDSGLERLREIAKEGFPEPLGVLVSDAASVASVLKQKLAERDTVLRQQMSLETDGVVIKVDSHKLRKELGVSSKYTNYQICFKPQSASGTTYLRAVTWQVGRTGKLSPVAECDSVILAGAKIERANLNNISWITTMGLKLGAKVEMLRSGDVIPQVVKVIDEGDEPILPPTNCPECQSPIEVLNEERSGITTHWCENKLCPGRITELFTYIASRDMLEIDGLGPEMAKFIAKNGYARDLAELFSFQTEALCGLTDLGEEKFERGMVKRGFGGAAVLKMIRSMEKAKKAGWDRWIAALGIPMIGRTHGKAIAKALFLQPDSMEKLTTMLEVVNTKEVEGLGPSRKESILAWARDAAHVRVCKELFTAGVRPASVGGTQVVSGAPLVGVVFCVTGERAEMDKDLLAAKLESLGAVKKSGVSKKVTHLIKLDSPGHNKLAYAQELIAAGVKIEIVGWDWVLKAFESGGIESPKETFEMEEV